MLPDLFKPAWKSRSVEKRLRAISEMDNVGEEQQKIADLHIEGDLKIRRAVKNGDDDAADQPTGNRRRYVELVLEA